MSISTPISIPTIYSPLTLRNRRQPPFNFTTPANFLHGRSKPTNHTLQFNPSIPKLASLTQPSLFSNSLAKLKFKVRAQNDREAEGSSSSSSSEQKNELEELRGESTMPDRFKYLTKEAPSPPLRWPWLIAVPFLIYAWRSVLWELSNWHDLLFGIFRFLGYLFKLLLALVYSFIGDPIAYAILYVESAVHAAHSFYSSIVTSAPVPELTFIIVLASTVLAIGKAASPNSITCQPYLLTAAGIIGFGAVRGPIIEPVFWLMLVVFFSYSRFLKKRDYVTSALPVATVLASVGEPWVRVIAIISFTALAIHHHSINLTGPEVASSGREVPLPLLAAALAIGIRVAAKWAGYRHLTWMVV